MYSFKKSGKFPSFYLNLSSTSRWGTKRIFGNDGSDEDTVEDLSAPKKPKLENSIDESQQQNQIETPNNGENNNSNTIIHGNSDHEMKLVKNENNIMEQAQNLISVRDEFKEHKEEEEQ